MCTKRRYRHQRTNNKDCKSWNSGFLSTRMLLTVTVPHRSLVRRPSHANGCSLHSHGTGVAWPGTDSSQESAPCHGPTAIQVTYALFAAVFVMVNWNGRTVAVTAWCRPHCASVLTDIIHADVMYIRQCD